MRGLKTLLAALWAVFFLCLLGLILMTAPIIGISAAL